MDKSEAFFQNLENALSKSTRFGLNHISRISFKDYPVEKNNQIRSIIDNWFENTVKSRDKEGIPRIKTVDDCSGMA